MLALVFETILKLIYLTLAFLAQRHILCKFIAALLVELDDCCLLSEHGLRLGGDIAQLVCRVRESAHPEALLLEVFFDELRRTIVNHVALREQYDSIEQEEDIS